MNTRWLPSVEDGVRAILVATFALCWTACVDIQGAAAEFNWSVRDFSGSIISRCERAGIVEVRLAWQSLANASPEQGVDRTPDDFEPFDCDVRHGVTKFNIPPGAQLLWILPICPDGDPPAPGTYSVPPPILREMRDGEVVSLDSLLIVAHDRGADLMGCNADACTCE